MQKRTYRPEHFMLKPIHGQCGPKYNVLFVARPHTLWCDLSVQMSTQHTECGESNLNCEGGGEKKNENTFHTACAYATHTHTHKHKHTKDKAQRKKFNRGLVPNCKREAAVTASKEQVSQIFLSTGMICSVSSSFGYSSQLLRPSQLSLCVSCCFARLLFLLKSVELSWCL